jgi:DNA-binding LytR/AlgR family response regulator
VIAAHIIVAFGARESFFQLLISWIYYRSLIPSFVIAFLLIGTVYWSTVYLDRRYDWRMNSLARAGLQIALGLIIPSLIAFLLATVYFAMFGYNIFKTYYLQFDFPLIVILLILLNVYYLAFYFYKRWEQSERLIMMPSDNNDITLKKPGNPKSKEVFVVQKGAKIIPLPVETISYFFHEGEYNFVRTFEKEDFMIAQPLDEVQQQLPDKQFFRVNRQMIVNFTSCQHFEPSEFGKLKLYVNPELKEPVIISQKRSKPFRMWIER